MKTFPVKILACTFFLLSLLLLQTQAQIDQYVVLTPTHTTSGKYAGDYERVTMNGRLWSGRDISYKRQHDYCTKDGYEWQDNMGRRIKSGSRSMPDWRTWADACAGEMRLEIYTP